MRDKIIANTKKFCGFKINIWGCKNDDKPSVLGEEAFAVGSIDQVYSDNDVTRRVNESAIEHLNLYIDWIKKKLHFQINKKNLSIKNLGFIIGFYRITRNRLETREIK